MTPDEHAARARDLLRTADEILARAIDENTGLSVENPMVHQQVQTLALLAQAHATLSLHQPGPPPSSAKRSSPVDRRPESRPDRLATDPSGEAGVARLTRWERLSETDFTDFSPCPTPTGSTTTSPIWTKPRMARSDAGTTTRRRISGPTRTATTTIFRTD